MLDEVLFALFHADDALAAAALRAVGADGGALDVALVRDGDDAGFVGDEVFDVDLALVGHDVGAARVAVLLFDFEQLGLHDAHELLLAGEQALEVLDALDEFEVFLLDLVAFEAGELVEAHLEDGVALEFGQLELVHQLLLRVLAVVGVLDDLDDGVDVVERDAEPFEDVGAFLGLLQFELRAPGDDFLAVRDVALDHLLDVHHARPTVVDRQHDDAERVFELRVLVEVVDDNLRNGVALQLDDDADAVLVGLVADIADVVELLFVDEFAPCARSAWPC